MTGMQLLRNYTIKQHENHLSGTWGDAEQKSGRVCKKQIDFIYIFFFMSVYISILLSKKCL